MSVRPRFTPEEQDMVSSTVKTVCDNIYLSPRMLRAVGKRIVSVADQRIADGGDD